MSLRYKISKEDSVIRVRTEGVFDFLQAYEMWEKIVAACNSHNCFRVLGQSGLEEPVPALDAYEHLGILESVGISPHHRIAWVAEDPALLDSLRIVETVVRNRSPFAVRMFDKMNDAERWLEVGD